MTARLASIILLFGALGAAAGVLRSAADGGPPDFNRHVRPILADNCLHCHGVDAAKRQGNLRLDDEASVLARGTVVPGNAAASPLIARIESTDPRRVMPPPDSHRSLTEAQRRTLARWIDAGAKFDAHWSFVAPVRTATPAAENPIDAIVSRRLRSEGLALSPHADRSTLLRRVTLDLTGLPPTPAEIDAFLADTAPGAYERVVDRLLASPRYGEKMALPWLDAARYADSNGFQQDGDTFQWLWRDWLVRELNKDTPYDRLATEMLAGDLLPDATDETRLATGFNRNHLLNGEGGAIPEENRWVTLFDRVDATATTFLGLTMSCAQCHDHKFDPITQRDYYALLDAFNRVPEDGLAPGAASRIRVAEPTLAYASAEQRARRAALEQAVRDAGEGDEHKPAREAAQHALDRYRFDEWPRVMVMSDAQPRETHILVRGEYLAPGEKVEFATPAFLPPLAPDAPRNRLGLAQWLFSPENPLVARVAVNRAWQVFFGDGLARTPEDFGVQSEVPLYQDLLDTLAVEFRESGWRTKALHRLIVTSAVYRQTSEASAVLYARDPENRLLARAPRFRLPSMVLRDIALASSGLLDASIGGAPVYPYQPDRVWEPLAITKERDFTYPASQGRELYRRSLYTFWRRTIAPANMFDTSQRQSCRVRVPVTNSPLHALVTLNDPTWVEAARVLAEQVSRERATPEARLAAAFERVVGRAPGAVERELLARMFARQHERYARDGAAAIALLSVGATPRDESFDPAEQAALASACLAILNLDEALTRG
ncbi:MAG: PSD1 and planctomycete cytochrome C domain-containing protein [bacterium]